MTRPQLAVALCTYNGEQFLRAQLDSLVQQQRPPDLVVVRDDGSTDGTSVILEDFAADAPFPVRILDGSTNLGSTRNFEEVLSACVDADLVALCDQDDVWYADKLARLEKALLSQPDAELVFCDAHAIDENGATLGWRIWQSTRLTPTTLQTLLGRGALDLLVQKNYVTGATVLMRASLLRAALPFPEAVRNHEIEYFIHDRWLSVVASATSRLVAVNEALMGYRIHSSQQVGLTAPGTTAHKPGRSGRPGLRATWTDLQDPEEARSLSVRRRKQLRRLEVVAVMLDEALGRDHAQVRAVASALDHRRVLRDLPRARWRRAPALFLELARGRYARRGLAAAVVGDLVRAPDPEDRRAEH